MGLRLLFDEFADIRHRIDIGNVIQVGSAPEYDDGLAVVPAEDWRPLSSEEAEHFRPDDDTAAERGGRAGHPLLARLAL